MKKILSALLAAALLSAGALAAGLDPVTEKSAADFADIPAGAWYYDDADTLIRAGGINGVSADSFDPDGAMTAAQFIKLVASLSLEDIPAPAEGETWYDPYLTAAAAAGITDGLTLSDPDAALSRYQMALIMANTAEILGETLDVVPRIQQLIPDWDQVPEQYAAAVAMSYSEGLITGRSDGRFDGAATLRRSEACAAVVRLFDASRRTPPAELDFLNPVTERPAVPDCWFENSLFIGNSLAEGFRAYSGVPGGGFRTAVSMTVFNAGSEASAAADYDNVYLMLGINEVGYGTESVVAAYGRLIDSLRAANPDVRVFVQSLLPVCEGRLTALQKQSGVTNENISALNSALLDMCLEKQAYYLDLHSLYADETGAMPEDMTWDGVHLQTQYYAQWYQYLRTHAVFEGQTV